MLGYTQGSIFEIIILAIFSTIVIKICIIFLGTLLSNERTGLRLLGVFLTISLTCVLFWILLVLLAISSSDVKLYGTYKFLSQTGYDYMIIDVMKCTFTLFSIIKRDKIKDSDSLGD